MKTQLTEIKTPSATLEMEVAAIYMRFFGRDTMYEKGVWWFCLLEPIKTKAF